MIEGFDYGSGPVPPAIIKAAGRKFVCRYVHPGKWTQMLQSEYLQLRSSEIEVVGVWQNTKTRSVEGGFDGGAHDMQEAIDYVRSIGGPVLAPIYIVAGDFDAQPSDMAAIRAYVDGAVSVRGYAYTGVYGGYHVINALATGNVCKYYWQTKSWSLDDKGVLQWHPKANIQQYGHDIAVQGYMVDYDRAMTVDYGQWNDCESPFAELFGPSGC